MSLFFPNTVLLVFPDKYWASIYCSNEDSAIKMAKSFGVYNKPGDKICLIDFETNKSIIYQLGDDLISTIY